MIGLALRGVPAIDPERRENDRARLKLGLRDARNRVVRRGYPT